MNYPHTNIENHRVTQYTSETCNPERASQHPLGTPPAYLWLLSRDGGKNRPNPSHYLADVVEGASSPGADM